MSSAGDTTNQLVVTVERGIATILLNRPEKRNAVTYAMWCELTEHCERIATDPGVRLLVVRGAGDHFCAGADIGGLAEVPIEEYRRANEAADRALAGFPKPSIAFIAGACVGGGAEIAIACDLRLASANARFGITPARLGIVYPAPAIERAVRLIGPSAAKHLLYSAELIDADRALRIGLVDELLEPEQAEERLHELTNLLASERSLLSQMAAKEMVDSVSESGSVGADIERKWADALAHSEDSLEGIAAFLERRKPRFKWSPGDS